MTDEPKKLDLRSYNIAEEKREELMRLFPEIRTEDGKIDFERLKRVLGETVDAGKERYGMNWPGKAECFRTIQTPSLGTLCPCPEESVNFDASENVFIEGDNLEVLKLLQKSYLGKVKMIYIDPPYNTGNDFIYPDNYTESLDTYLEYTGQIDAEGHKFGTNTEADGRFHSKWLNMMYPRLYLARNLLREDGVIFISIDENEVTNLKRLVVDIFGEENFIGAIANVNNPKGRSDDKFVATAHEYIIIAARNKSVARVYGFEPEENITRRYNKLDQHGKRYREIDLRKTGDEDRRVDRPDMFYYFYFNQTSGVLRVSKEKDTKPNEIEIIPLREDGVEGRWRWGLDTTRAQIGSLLARYMPNRKIWGVFEKDYLHGRPPVKATSAWMFKDVNSERGSEQLIELGFAKEVFPRPKPVGTMRRVLEMGTFPDEPAVVLDFFAGSCSLVEAVFSLNAEGARNISFIAVQLPERLDQENSDQKAAYDFCANIGSSKNIAEIGKERIRRVIKKLNDVDASKLDLDDPTKLDRGFRVFKLSESNFKPWNAEAPKDAEGLAKQLEMHVDHIRDGRTASDLLYEILLKSGFPLTTPVETLTLAGKAVHSVAGGALFICLERELTLELIRAMGEKKPERVVYLDEGFAGNDQLKANAVQIFKTKGITSFKTV